MLVREKKDLKRKLSYRICETL